MFNRFRFVSVFMIIIHVALSMTDQFDNMMNSGSVSPDFFDLHDMGMGSSNYKPGSYERKSNDDCEQALLNCKEIASSTKGDVKMRKFIQHVINSFEPDVVYNVMVTLYADDIETLKRSLDAGYDEDVDYVLLQFMSKIRRLDGGHFEWKKIFYDLLPKFEFDYYSMRGLISVSAILVLTFVSLWLYWRGVPLLKLFVMIVLISIPWHWINMTLQSAAKKEAVMMAASEGCFSPSTIWDYFTRGSSTEACEKYFQASVIDAFIEISFGMAFADAVHSIVFIPFENFGHNTGLYFKALLSHLSWLSTPIVLCFIFSVFMCLCFMFFGYRIRLPFFMGAIEPSRTTSQALPKDLSSDITNTLNAHLSLVTKQIGSAVQELNVKQSTEQGTGDEPRLIDLDNEDLQNLDVRSPNKRLKVTTVNGGPSETEFEWIESDNILCQYHGSEDLKTDFRREIEYIFDVLEPTKNVRDYTTKVTN